MDDKTVMFADTISDAFEGRLCANYLWFNPAKKAWEVKPTECWIKPHKLEKISCESDVDFDSLIDKFFGIGR